LVALNDKESKAPKEVEISTGEETVIKPKRATKKSKKSATVDPTQTVVLICTLSSIIASRPNCEHWLISPVEAEQVATPLLKIIEENEKLKEVGKYGDYIALAVACGVIATPRIMLSFDNNKRKKREVLNNGIQRNGNGKESGKIIASDEPLQEKTSTDTTNYVSNIHDAIPPLGAGY